MDLKALGHDWDSTPQYVNEKGDKFWLDTSSTDYAKSKGLVGVQVLYVLEPNDRKTRIVVENGIPVYENQSTEQIGAHLDIMFIKKEFGR